MEKWQAFLMNLYEYEEILDETLKGIQLLIKTDDAPKAYWLPKKSINIFLHLKEVEIPEWLCIKTGLLPVLEINKSPLRPVPCALRPARRAACV